MTLKHTPGPWYESNLVSGKLSITSDPMGAKPVAYVPYRKARCLEDKANAQLIAAAPDLLEALQWIVEGYDSGENLLGPKIAHGIAEARAAIAKATGPQGK